MGPRKKLWIFSFEFGPAKLGGLGEVPTNQSKHLKDSLDITVFSPAHWLVQGNQDKILCSPEPVQLVFTQNFGVLQQDARNGQHFLTDFPKIADVTVKPYNVSLPFPGVRMLAFSGIDPLSRKILDDPVIYSMDGLRSKIAVFSNAIKQYTLHLLAIDRESLPDVIHVHDYHAVPACIAMRQKLLQAGLDVATIFTVHLLTWPKVDDAYLSCCGIDTGMSMPFTVNGNSITKTPRELIHLANNRLEYMAAFSSDLVTSVSKTYLNENVIPNCGDILLEGKTDFIHNGCDWDYNTIYPAVLDSLRDEIGAFLGHVPGAGSSRRDLRRFLLTWMLGNLPPGEPQIEDPVILERIARYDGRSPFITCGRIEPFPGDGPLILVTGRASKQKGIENLLQAMPRVIETFPAARLLLKLIPTQGELKLVDDYTEMVIQSRFKNNIRILWGKGLSIYHLAHLAADVYVGSSRWEPFGIMVLEANSLGLPVVGSAVGGLKETIIDARVDPVNGTGLLVKDGDVMMLAEAIIDMLCLSEASELVKVGDLDGARNIAAKVSNPRLQLIAQETPSFYSIMRENARKRVETAFRWSIVSKKELTLISTAIDNKNLRK
nr:glycosyltransferase [Candidatus Sigynarchaeota archaeon]